MSNTVRMVNGSTIQVRTGVIQGIGPQGPKGIQGNPGPQGDQGPVGEVGPMGQINQQQSRANVSTVQPIAPNTDTVMSFNTNVIDDLAAIAASVITLKDIGDYLVSVWLGIDKPAGTAAGGRNVRIQSATNGILARCSTTAIGNDFTYIQCTIPFRTTVGNEVISIVARSSDTVAVNCTTGAVSVVRVGSGPRGEIGEVGPQGPVGPTGAIGNPGPQGNAGSGYSTYSALKAP